MWCLLYVLLEEFGYMSMCNALKCNEVGLIIHGYAENVDIVSL